MINSYEKIVSSIKTYLKDFIIVKTEKDYTAKNQRHSFVFYDKKNRKFYIRKEFDDRKSFYEYTLIEESMAVIKNISDILNKNIKRVLDIDNHSMFDFIIQQSIFQGIIKWLFSEEKDEILDEYVFPFLDRIKKIVWETYESQNITKIIAFYDSNISMNETHETIVDFLNSKYVSPIAKYEYSALLVDENSFRIKEYIGHSTIGISNIDEYNLPIEYVSIINNCNENFSKKDKKIVYFIINDRGEILIVKDKRLFLIINGNDCSFFHFEFYKHSLFKFVKKSYETIILINTLIDVSFARTGGLLCILENDNEIVNVLKIVKDIDNFYIDYDSILKKIESKKRKDNSYKVDEKELEKRKAIEILLNKYKKDNGTINFYEIDRALRKDLLSLDGATIITKDGTLIATGAILTKVKAGNGGGRTAAKEELEKYGMSIKISADGDIIF